MADHQSPKAPRARQTRKSLAHLPSMDPSENQENATIDSASFSAMVAKTKQTAKKTRSKSLGPGGLDALKEGTGNRGRPSLPQLKSILKQTMPLSLSPKSPPKAAGNAASSKSPKKTGEKSPDKSPRKSPTKAGGVYDTGAQRSPGKSSGQSNSPFGSPSRVALRTEEEQQAAAKEKELQEIQARKEARRKSLAARRVSFAPEATLHTWNVVELPEDSTTSSAATNTTRRSSGLTADTQSFNDGHASPPRSDGSEPPSTPPEQTDDIQVAQSPAHQRDMHQKKRRRSSTIPAMNFDEPHEPSSSPFSGESDDDTGTQAFETADEGTDSESDDDVIVQDETVQNVDGDDSTFHSSSSITSDGKLDAALQQAARQAGTRGIAYDEHGDDMTMEMADDEVTEAFQPWMQQSRGKALVGDENALLDQENVNPFSPAFKANVIQRASKDEDDMTMDMTQAVGGILPMNSSEKSSPKGNRRKSVMGAGRRRSSMARRRASTESPVNEEDQSMDFTTAVGQIHGIQEPTGLDAENNTEDVSMDFTSVVGGVLANADNVNREADLRRESMNSRMSEEDMEFTQAIGGILSSITERTEPDDQTMEMDMTKAVGSILPKPSSVAKTEAKALMELETDVGQISNATPFHDGSPQKPMGAGLDDERPIRPQAQSASPFHEGPAQKPMGAGLQDERPLPTQTRKSMTSETGSPGLVISQASPGKTSTGRRPGRPSKSPKSSPFKKPATPSKQLTPRPMRPITPGKTPPPSAVAMRSSSPKKLFEAEIKSAKKEAEKTTPQSKQSDALFQRDPVTGAVTPSVVLRPHKRRSSGFGIDREGLGSPRVSALLDRRSSIGDTAKAFAPQVGPAPSVRFEDPRALEQEVERERAEDARAESGLGALQDEADSQDLHGEEDSTSTLKGMIESMTPQKRKLNGRKSLHVGAAKGILGKRPAELDDDDDDEDATPKKLKGREGSPVKKVKLPGPKTGKSATGRVTRSSRLSLAETAGNARSDTPTTAQSPAKNNTTPRGQIKFKNAVDASPAKVTSFEDKVNGREGAVEQVPEDNRLRLQDFLQVTGIRFMDQLTTTKRRHTMAPHLVDQDGDVTLQGRDMAGDSKAAQELEACVVAGACTIPMLELYQHSCRELKSYISEGRKVVKEIEQATYEDNPPLFQEYLSAPADVRPIMDNQFKNVKTNARLLSKATWYEWRMKLLEGLKEGLTTIGRSMEEDARSLTQQEQILQPVFPALTEEHEDLTQQVQLAQSRADELAHCDQEELKSCRERLVGLDEDLADKRRAVEELENQLREKEDRLEAALNQKQECVTAIEEAEGIRQQCRGWSTAEIAALQAKVRRLETAHGWSISAVTGDALAMTYKKDIQLHFSPSAFDLGAENKNATRDNAAISLTYVADANEYHPKPLTTEKRFFLQIIRAQLQCLQQSQTSPPDLLAFVSKSWDTALRISEEAKALDVGWLTEPAIRGDEVIAISSLVYLPAMQTKVEATFEVKVISGQGVHPVDMSVEPSVRVCYGENLNEAKMSDFMASRIKGVEGYGVWAQATKELEDKLIARGRKERK